MHWTPDEDAEMRRWYGKESVTDTAARLHRTKDSVKLRARALGIAAQADPVWSDKEDEYLRTHYPNTGLKKLSEVLNRSKNAVKGRAAKLGIEKTPAGTYDSIVETGNFGCPGVHTLTPIELGYVAGLLDGEGCITASVTRQRYTTLCLCITNTHRGVIDWLHGKLGGGTIQVTENRNKPCFRWTLGNGQAIKEFLRVIAPHLKIKQRQAEIALSWEPRMDAESTARLVAAIQALNRPTRVLPSEGIAQHG